MKEREALKLALEALKTFHYAMIDAGVLDRQEVLNQGFTTATAIKEALAQPELCKYGQEPKSCTSSPMDCQCALDATFAQPEQEPVGQLLEEAYGRGQVMWFNKPDDFSMLYTTPPQRTWVGLTDEEMEKLSVENGKATFLNDDEETGILWFDGDCFALLKAAEAKLKEKNNG